MTTKPSYRALNRAEAKLRAINHPMRLKILRFLSISKPTVMQICWHLREDQSTVSQHLAILLKSEFVTREQHGKYAIYQPNYPEIERISEICAELAEGVDLPSPIKREYERSIY